MKKYYVYAHLDPITKKIFYVGKGTNNRAYEQKSRTEKWRDVAREFKLQGLTHETVILHICETEEDALILEKEEIAKHDNLVNEQNQGTIPSPEESVPKLTLVDIGRRIRDRRIALNIRACRLAKSVKISRTTYAKIEEGEHGKYEFFTLLKILNLLQLKIRMPVG